MILRKRLARLTPRPSSRGWGQDHGWAAYLVTRQREVVTKTHGLPDVQSGYECWVRPSRGQLIKD
jgi:hypothetical protein